MSYVHSNSLNFYRWTPGYRWNFDGRFRSFSNAFERSDTFPRRATHFKEFFEETCDAAGNNFYTWDVQNNTAFYFLGFVQIVLSGSTDSERYLRGWEIGWWRRKERYAVYNGALTGNFLELFYFAKSWIFYCRSCAFNYPNWLLS